MDMGNEVRELVERGVVRYSAYHAKAPVEVNDCIASSASPWLGPVSAD